MSNMNILEAASVLAKSIQERELEAQRARILRQQQNANSPFRTRKRPAGARYDRKDKPATWPFSGGPPLTAGTQAARPTTAPSPAPTEESQSLAKRRAETVHGTRNISMRKSGPPSAVSPVRAPKIQYQCVYCGTIGTTDHFRANGTLQCKQSKLSSYSSQVYKTSMI